MTKIDKKIKGFWKNIWNTSTEDLKERTFGHRIKQYGYLTIKVILSSGKKAYDDNIFVRSSGLSFTAILSLIPTITVAFALFASFSSLNELEDKLMDNIFKIILPPIEYENLTQDMQGQSEIFTDEQLERINNLESFLISLLNEFRESATGLSIISLIFMFFTATSVFRMMESAINDIWRIKKRRSLIENFISFWAVLTLGPLIFGASIYLVFQQKNDDMLVPIIRVIFPLFVTWLGLFLIYLALPYTKVKWKSAMIGGIVAGLLFEVGKNGFAYYTQLFGGKTYQTIYGALFLIPIFLLWTYISFLFVLYGASLAFIIQHPNLYFLNKKGQLSEHIEPDQGNLYTLLKILLTIYIYYYQKEDFIPLNSLEDSVNINKKEIDYYLNMLQDRGILDCQEKHQDKQYFFKSPPDKLSIQKLLYSVWENPKEELENEGEKAANEDPMEQAILKVIENYDTSLSSVFSKMTITSLAEEVMVAKK